MMKNKKAIAVLLLVAMLFSIMPTAVFAESNLETTTAYVTIVNKEGELVVTHQAIAVNDNNENGYTDIHDALYTAHEKFYTGGAEEGYQVKNGALAKLWGDNSSANGFGCFGYYVNNASAWGLTDSVRSGDHVVAFVYQDQINWSDVYSYFNTDAITISTGSQLDLQLTGAYYGPISDTLISVNGSKTDIRTNENGSISLNFDEKGKYLISTTESSLTLVPPICEVNVVEELTAEDALLIGENSIQRLSPIVLTPYDANVLSIVKAELEKRVQGVEVCDTVSSTDSSVINTSGSVISYNAEKTSVNVTFELNSGAVERNVTIEFIVPAKNEKTNATVSDLLNGIAAKNTDNSEEWFVMDMAAYKLLNPYSYKLTDDAKQTYINKVISDIAKKEPLSDTTYAKAIIILTALGIDPTQLYSVNSNVPFDAVSKLNTVSHSISAWSAPYTLLAYQQGDYETDTYEANLISALLGSKKVNGNGEVYWDEYGTIQTTANVITALAKYASNNNAVKEIEDEIEVAIEGAIKYLSRVQLDDGRFQETDSYYTGPDSNTSAMVIIGLSAVGVDVSKDSRFIKNGNSALDGLLYYALDNNSDFGYQDNTGINGMATEQGFRALIAASYVMNHPGKAFNIYDFSGNELTPGRATGAGVVVGPSAPPADNDDITVKMSVRADNGYWMRNQSVTVKEGSTVYHALIKALEKYGMQQEGAELGYVESITYNGRTLSEFDLGPNSGWLYAVNGELPEVGLLDYTLCNGDNILWYYTEDWTQDSLASSRVDDKDEDKKDEESKPTTTPVTELVDDVDGHWAIDAIQFVYDRGLLTGISENEFAPDMAVTRAMMATIMYGMAGNPEHGWHYPFHDVFDMAWYAGPVAWAYENKLVYGVSDTSYAPETSITREQVAMMLMRYANFKGYDISQTVSLNHYKDAKNVSDYAESAMQWAVAIGMIGGRTADTLCAQDTATRAELSVMLRNFITLYEPVDSNNSTTK